jgi:hypothetical protein
MEEVYEFDKDYYFAMLITNIKSFVQWTPEHVK